jgi:hypothetical protein
VSEGFRSRGVDLEVALAVLGVLRAELDRPWSELGVGSEGAWATFPLDRSLGEGIALRRRDLLVGHVERLVEDRSERIRERRERLRRNLDHVAAVRRWNAAVAGEVAEARAAVGRFAPAPPVAPTR